MFRSSLILLLLLKSSVYATWYCFRSSTYYDNGAYYCYYTYPCSLYICRSSYAKYYDSNTGYYTGGGTSSSSNSYYLLSVGSAVLADPAPTNADPTVDSLAFSLDSPTPAPGPVPGPAPIDLLPPIDPTLPTSQPPASTTPKVVPSQRFRMVPGPDGKAQFFVERIKKMKRIPPGAKIIIPKNEDQEDDGDDSGSDGSGSDGSGSDDSGSDDKGSGKGKENKN